MKIQEKNKYKYLALTRSTKKFKIIWDGIPAFLKNNEPEASLRRHFLPSIVGHFTLFLIIMAVFGLLNLMGIPDKLKDNDKIQNIEFKLSGGKYNKGKNHRQKAKSAPAASAPANLEQKPQPKQNSTPQEVTKPKVSAKTITKNSKNVFKTAVTPASDDFSIPMPKVKSFSSGTGGSGRRAAGHYSGSSSGSGTDNFSDAYASGDGSGNGSGSGKGSGFDKNAVKKTVGAYDISPYVNELKREIRWNWKAPKEHENKNVELFLRIAKDGRLVILNVKRTSEVGAVDEAALSAVRKTQPLNPLPSKYPKSYLDVVFTFNSGTSSVGSRW